MGFSQKKGKKQYILLKKKKKNGGIQGKVSIFQNKIKNKCKNLDLK
jgi:hypothetical protein